MDEKGGSGLEEERRLAYVGITRARKRLFISYASSRRVHGQWQSSIPSRFVGELPDENISEDIEDGMIGARSTRPNTEFAHLQPTAASGYGPGWSRLQERRKSGFTPARPPAEGAQTIAGLNEYDVGDRVFHQKFGNGNVRSVEGDKLYINFDKAGQKKVVASFISLVRKGG